MRTGLMAALGLIFGAAASAADVPASADLATLPRYPQARIVDYRQEAVPERIVPKGFGTPDQWAFANGGAGRRLRSADDHHLSIAGKPMPASRLSIRRV